MRCRLSDLRHKEVVNLQDGEKLGYVDDVELEPDTASLLALVLLGRERLWGLLRREPDLVIPVSKIRLIGKDTILVTLAEGEERTAAAVGELACSTKKKNFVYKYLSGDGENLLERSRRM